MSQHNDLFEQMNQVNVHVPLEKHFSMKMPFVLSSRVVVPFNISSCVLGETVPVSTFILVLHVKAKVLPMNRLSVCALTTSMNMDWH